MKLNDEEYFNINDTYNIKETLRELKQKIEVIENDIEKFLGHRKVKDRGSKARKKLVFLKNELIPLLSRKILKQNQDYKSDYE